MVLLPPVLLHLKCSISVYIGNCPPLSRENHCAGLYSFNSCMCVFVFVCWTALGLKARSTESQCSDGFSARGRCSAVVSLGPDMVMRITH